MFKQFVLRAAFRLCVFFVFGAWLKNYAPIYAPFNGKYCKMTAQRNSLIQRKCFIYL